VATQVAAVAVAMQAADAGGGDALGVGGSDGRQRWNGRCRRHRGGEGGEAGQVEMEAAA